MPPAHAAATTGLSERDPVEIRCTLGIIVDLDCVGTRVENHRHRRGERRGVAEAAHRYLDRRTTVDRHQERTIPVDGEVNEQFVLTGPSTVTLSNNTNASGLPRCCGPSVHRSMAR